MFQFLIITIFTTHLLTILLLLHFFFFISIFIIIIIIIIIIQLARQRRLQAGGLLRRALGAAPGPEPRLAALRGPLGPAAHLAAGPTGTPGRRYCSVFSCLCACVRAHHMFPVCP